MKLNIRSTEKKSFVLRIGKAQEALPVPWSLWSPAFRELVQKALDASRKAEKMQAPGAAKLSCDAFLRQTLAISKATSLRRVHDLRRKLDRGDPGLDYSRSALRVMIKELQGPYLRTPPKAETWERSARWFLRPRVTEVMSELSAVDATPLELFGVAILIAGETPGIFGTANGEQDKIDTDIAAVAKRRDELFALIGTRWTADDVDAGLYNQGHTSPAKFKGTPVDVAPTESAGRRLIQHLHSGQRLIEALTKQRKP